MEVTSVSLEQLLKFCISPPLIPMAFSASCFKPSPCQTGAWTRICQKLVTVVTQKSFYLYPFISSLGKTGSLFICFFWWSSSRRTQTVWICVKLRTRESTSHINVHGNISLSTLLPYPLFPCFPLQANWHVLFQDETRTRTKTRTGARAKTRPGPGNTTSDILACIRNCVSSRTRTVIVPPYSALGKPLLKSCLFWMEPTSEALHYKTLRCWRESMKLMKVLEQKSYKEQLRDA